MIRASNTDDRNFLISLHLSFCIQSKIVLSFFCLPSSTLKQLGTISILSKAEKILVFSIWDFVELVIVFPLITFVKSFHELWRKIVFDMEKEMFYKQCINPELCKQAWIENFFFAKGTSIMTSYFRIGRYIPSRYIDQNVSLFSKKNK